MKNWILVYLFIFTVLIIAFIGLVSFFPSVYLCY